MNSRNRTTGGPVHPPAAGAARGLLSVAPAQGPSSSPASCEAGVAPSRGPAAGRRTAALQFSGDATCRWQRHVRRASGELSALPPTSGALPCASACAAPPQPRAAARAGPRAARAASRRWPTRPAPLPRRDGGTAWGEPLARPEALHGPELLAGSAARPAATDGEFARISPRSTVQKIGSPGAAVVDERHEGTLPRRAAGSRSRERPAGCGPRTRAATPARGCAVRRLPRTGCRRARPRVPARPRRSGRWHAAGAPSAPR